MNINVLTTETPVEQLQPPFAPARRAPRTRSAPAPQTRLRLEERDLRLLHFLWAHTVASRSQLQEMFFGSTPRANARLRQLFDHGLVRRHSLALSPLGSWGEEAVYGLGTKAFPILIERFEIESQRLHELACGQATPLFARHALATVEIGLGLRRAALSASDVELQQWLGENEARHHYEWRLPATGHWKNETFKPDGFVRLGFAGVSKPHASKPYVLAAFIECDMGHTSARGWQSKLDTYHRYSGTGLFEQTYGDYGFVVLCVTTGERRRDHLRELARVQGAPFLRLTTFSEMQKPGPFASIWHSPRCEATTSLQGDTG